MKRIMLFVVLMCSVCLFGSMASALDISFGVKGGANLANYIGEDATSSNDMKFGYIAGAFGEISLIEMVAIQPEVLLSLNGTRVDISGTVYKQNLTYIDIPVVVKVYPPILLPVKLNVFAGPYAGVNIISKEKADGSTTDIKDIVETMDFGLTFGAGADFRKITFDGRYSLGLADISKNTAQVLKNGVISMMVGYRLK